LAAVCDVLEDTLLANRRLMRLGELKKLDPRIQLAISSFICRRDGCRAL
jgi:hypothetical protein